MKAKRRRHDGEFKPRSSKRSRATNHPTDFQGFRRAPGAGLRVEEDHGGWRGKRLRARADKTGADDFERERAQLHAKIGQQAIELDWLRQKSRNNSVCEGTQRVGGKIASQTEHEDNASYSACPLVGGVSSRHRGSEDIRIKRLLDEFT
ncbi:MAG: hypothetical protein R3F31_25240 [Verrucomicrobiales bacterium]